MRQFIHKQEGLTKRKVEQQVKKLYLSNIIEPCTSERSPVVPIREMVDTLRLCVDYRWLNRVTEVNRLPMANFTETIFACNGTHYFPSLDLVKEYYQM